MWFALIIIGYFLLAIVAILDKLILTKSVGRPIVYTFYSTVFLIFAFGIGLFFPLGEMSVLALFWGLVSGFAFGLGMWTMFVAFKKGEVSHIAPFIAAVITIATYALSTWILGEELTALQTAGVLVLVFASFLLSFERSRKHDGFHMGFVWAILSGVIFAISHVSSKYLYDHYSFITGLVWARGTTGIFGLALLMFPPVRQALTHHHGALPKTYGKRHALAIVVANKIISVVGIVILHYAIAVGSVIVVNALAGLQEALTFVMILALTKWAPRILKEYFTRHEITIQMTAIALILLGSIIFVL